MKFLPDAVWDGIQAELSWMREQNEKLTERLVELKRDGFARPTPSIAREAMEPEVDDRILAAIRARAPEGSKLERELITFANAQLLAEGEIEDIADTILAGGFGDED